MNAFLNVLEQYQDLNIETVFKREQLNLLQVNLGNLCNQSCTHCHVGASPLGKNIMGKSVIDDILSFLKSHPGLTLDLTGGAPEMNPYFNYFVRAARPLVCELIVRTNLTVFFEKGKEGLPLFFKEHNLHVIGSLPCYLADNVNKQRGEGVFGKSISALKILNGLGYGKDKGLILDLVYNPGGAFLPPNQQELEKSYKQELSKESGIVFTHLLTITNAPIKNFKHYLEQQGQYEQYLKLLKDNFNGDVLKNLMCKSFISVGFDGKLYDCDFNQALGLVIVDKQGKAMTVDQLKTKELSSILISCKEHCLACTAGAGSSCRGVLG